MSIADRFTGPGDDPAMSKLALELRRSVIAESNLVAVADRTTALNLDLLEPYTLDPLPAGADWQEGLREWQRADVIGHGADPDEVAAMDDDELARESECDVWISEHDVIGLAAAAKGKRS
jgi:hypothetical protein